MREAARAVARPVCFRLHRPWNPTGFKPASPPPTNALHSESRRCHCRPRKTAAPIELLKAPLAGEEAVRVELFTHRVPAGVDDAAKAKASYLAAVAHGSRK